MGCCFCNNVSGQGGPGEEPQQDGCGAGDGQIGPLALGFHAQVGSHLLESNFQLPAQLRTIPGSGSQSADGSVHSKAWVAKEPWGSRISTQRMRMEACRSGTRPPFAT